MALIIRVDVLLVIVAVAFSLGVIADEIVGIHKFLRARKDSRHHSEESNGKNVTR